MFRIIKRAPWIAIGAAAAWLFDSERGPARRQQAKEKLNDLVKGDSNGQGTYDEETLIGAGAPAPAPR